MSEVSCIILPLQYAPSYVTTVQAILGSLLQRLTDIFSGPKFQIEIIDSSSLLPDTPEEVKFINVVAKNINRNWLKRFFVRNNIANNARA